MTAYTKSDRVTGWIVFGIVAVCLALFLAGCTAEQQSQFEKDHPSLVAGTDKGATILQTTSQNPLAQAAVSNVPWGGDVLWALGAIATFYLGHRNGVKTTTKAALELTGTGKPLE